MTILLLIFTNMTLQFDKNYHHNVKDVTNKISSYRAIATKR